jgi:hypothetical protein
MNQTMATFLDGELQRRRDAVVSPRLGGMRTVRGPRPVDEAPEPPRLSFAEAIDGRYCRTCQARPGSPCVYVVPYYLRNSTGYPGIAARARAGQPTRRPHAERLRDTDEHQMRAWLREHAGILLALGTSSG